MGAPFVWWFTIQGCRDGASRNAKRRILAIVPGSSHLCSADRFYSGEIFRPSDELETAVVEAAPPINGTKTLSAWFAPLVDWVLWRVIPGLFKTSWV
jgi:hypothetical protein